MKHCGGWGSPTPPKSFPKKVVRCRATRPPPPTPLQTKQNPPTTKPTTQHPPPSPAPTAPPLRPSGAAPARPGPRPHLSPGAAARGARALLAPPELRATAGHGSTKGVVGGSFPLNTRIAFGDGCDRHSYVSAESNFTQADRK